MIVRARPRFIENVDAVRYLCKEEDFSDYEEAGFFFGSGRAALKFFLSCYSECLGRPVKVMIQAFNCSVVKDAVVESGNSYLLCDIGLEDFSVRIETLELSEDFDVLLLLHYQGIPNVDYLAIANFCRVRGILLVEDLAHGDRSMINGVRIGTLADACLYSYAFDKPLTSMRGGRIVLGGGILNSKFYDLFVSRYEFLPIESNSSSLRDLNLLFFLYKYTDRENYHVGLNYYDFIRMFSGLDWQLLYLFSMSRAFKFFAYAFGMLSRNKSIPIYKLSPRKVALIQEQELVMESVSCIDVSRLERALTNLGGRCVSYSKGSEIFWNRYSLLDTGGVAEKLQSMGVEARNYNWPSVLSCENGIGVFPKSECAARHIVNIPIWAEIDV